MDDDFEHDTIEESVGDETIQDLPVEEIAAGVRAWEQLRAQTEHEQEQRAPRSSSREFQAYALTE